MDDRQEKFCEELTDLLLKHGFGIADRPYIFTLCKAEYWEMTDDFDRKAYIDEENRLHFI